jgi:hypothetical protein
MLSSFVLMKLQMAHALLLLGSMESRHDVVAATRNGQSHA